MSHAPRARVFVGAALPLLGFPIAVAAYAVFVSSDHRLDRTILVVWQDNQVALSVLAGVGLLATLGSSLLLFSGLRHPSAAMFGVIPLAGVISLLGVGLATWTVRSNLVSPRGSIAVADVPFFVMAVTREGLTILVAGLFVSLAILVGSGVAQLALGKRPGIAGSLVCCAGACATGVAVQRLVALTDGIGRAVHSLSRSWLEELVHETSPLGPSRVPMAALLVVVALAAAVWAMRRQPALAMPLAVLGMGAAIPAASVGLTLALVSSASRQLAPPTHSRQPLMTVHGRPSSGPMWLLQPTGLSMGGYDGAVDSRFVEDELTKFRDLVPVGAVSVSVGLGRGSRADDLISFLEAVGRVGVNEVGLVGQYEVEIVAAAPELRVLLEQFRALFREVDLVLVSEDRAQFVLSRTTELQALLLAAEEPTARREPLRVHVRP